MLRRHHWPHWFAIVVALLVTIVVIARLIYLVKTPIRSGLVGLGKRSVTSYNNFKAFRYRFMTARFRGVGLPASGCSTAHRRPGFVLFSYRRIVVERCDIPWSGRR
jgi:hypothetical protein